jgi:hypothetical protein
LDTGAGQRRRHVVIVVVVAEDAKHAVSSRQRRQHFRDGSDERAIAPGDIVAAEDNQVRLLFHHQRDRAGDILVRHQRTAMDVGEQTDAQACEGGRQRAHRKVSARDAEIVTAVEESVRSRAGRRADTSREQRFQNRPARHRYGHRLSMITRA